MQHVVVNENKYFTTFLRHAVLSYFHTPPNISSQAGIRIYVLSPGRIYTTPDKLQQHVGSAAKLMRCSGTGLHVTITTNVILPHFTLCLVYTRPLISLPTNVLNSTIQRQSLECWPVSC